MNPALSSERRVADRATVWAHYYGHDEPVSGKEVRAVMAALDRNLYRDIQGVAASLDHDFASHPAK